MAPRARGYSELGVRPSALAVLALIAAAVGGVVSVFVADRTGLVGGTETVVVAGSVPALPVEREIETSDGAAKPLAGNSFDPATIYRSRSGGVVTVYAYFDDRPPAERAAQGSGFVISREGYILTSAHVVTTAGEGESQTDAADRVFVAFRDRDRVEARVVGWDVFDDVSVLKVEPSAHPLDPVPLGDSASVVVGEPVAALGSPFGNESSLAVGVVSATQRSIDSLTSEYTLPDAIQTDAPINAAKRSFRQLVRTGRVAYAYAGVNAEDLTPTIARRFGYTVERGAVIATVVSESPASRAGLRGGSDQ